MTAEKTPKAGGIPVYCAHDKIVAIEEVWPNPRNPNQHPEEQIALLAKIIKKQGWRAPITVSTLSNQVVRGHGRLMAAKRLGVRQVPVDYQDYSSEQEEWADLIADNRIAELAEIDNKLLMDLIGEIDDGTIDITLTGFSEEALTAMIGAMTGETDTVLTDEDEIPELPAEMASITEPGDTWLLGPHRLRCGDATDEQTIAELMQGDLAAAVFTDPPYGVDYVAASGKFKKIQGDDQQLDELIVRTLAPAFKLMARHTTQKAAFYIFHASQTRKEYDYALTAAGLCERQYLTWVKPALVMGWADYQWQTEPFYYASKDGFSPEYYGDRKNTTAWYVARAGAGEVSITLGQGIALTDGEGAKIVITPTAVKGKKLRHIRLTQAGQKLAITQADEHGTAWEVGRDGQAEHPTQKPVELARRAIENSTKPSEIVIDFFLGSGTTLIAAEATGRICYGTELDPDYCDQIVHRWEKFTGRRAERIRADGKTANKVEIALGDNYSKGVEEATTGKGAQDDTTGQKRKDPEEKPGKKMDETEKPLEEGTLQEGEREKDLDPGGAPF